MFIHQVVERNLYEVISMVSVIICDECGVEFEFDEYAGGPECPECGHVSIVDFDYVDYDCPYDVDGAFGVDD